MTNVAPKPAARTASQLTDHAPNEDAILPFEIDIPQVAVEDIKERLGNTRWPDELPAEGSHINSFTRAGRRGLT